MVFVFPKVYGRERKSRSTERTMKWFFFSCLHVTSYVDFVIVFFGLLELLLFPKIAECALTIEMSLPT